MIFDSLFKYGLNADTFHRFSYFLGTEAGELLKNFVEMIFLSIIVYMIISEFKKNGKREYKYLIVGFFALFASQAVTSIILFSKVFSVDRFVRFDIVLTIIEGYFETAALLLLVSAFIFPIFKKETIRFQKIMLSTFLIITLTIFSTYLFFKNGPLQIRYTLSILEMMQIFVLVTPFYVLNKLDYKKLRYGKSILLAFFIYLLIPLMNFISYMISGYVGPKLRIIEFPLPFISILLLMRAVYLTLVDKAFLRIKLKKSEDDVKHEREMNKLKDHFISVVSHELKTPVTSMKLYLSLLFSGKFGKILPKQKKAILTLSDENTRLFNIIDDLLIMNKIEAKKLVLDKSKFKVLEIIDPIYIENAKSRGISVNSKIKNLNVFGDKARLKQVYINLINNATKFSNNKGNIVLDAGIEKKNWWFCVKDTGIGIEQGEISKMFDKFYQIENTITRKNSGIGLGLSIVKSIVNLHKGNVQVKSKIGKGTEIKVIFPNR